MGQQLFPQFIRTSIDASRIVVLHRDGPADSITGVPIQLGDELASLVKVDDTGAADGVCVIRLESVVRSHRGGRELEAFERRLDRKDPCFGTELDLSGIPGVLTSLSTLAGYVTIHLEDQDPDICLIGELKGMDESAVQLEAYGTMSAQDRSEVITFADEITRIEAFGRYEQTLLSALRD